MYVECTYILSSCTHACACYSPRTAPTSWLTSSTLPGLTTECPSTPHHWSSLFRKWGRYTATAKCPWWCTAGEGEMHVCILYSGRHNGALSHHVWMTLHVSYTEQGLFACFYYIYCALYQIKYICLLVQCTGKMKVSYILYSMYTLTFDLIIEAADILILLTIYTLNQIAWLRETFKCLSVLMYCIYIIVCPVRVSSSPPPVLVWVALALSSLLMQWWRDWRREMTSTSLSLSMKWGPGGCAWCRQWWVFLWACNLVWSRTTLSSYHLNSILKLSTVATYHVYILSKC